MHLPAPQPSDTILPLLYCFALHHVRPHTKCIILIELLQDFARLRVDAILPAPYNAVRSMTNKVHRSRDALFYPFRSLDLLFRPTAGRRVLAKNAKTVKNLLTFIRNGYKIQEKIISLYMREKFIESEPKRSNPRSLFILCV